MKRNTRKGRNSVNSVLDESEADFSEDFSHATDCRTPVYKKYGAKDQLRMFFMCNVYHEYKRDKDI